MVLRGRKRQVEFFLENTQDDVSKGDVCFMAEIFIEGVSKPIGLGQCASLIWKAADHRYFIVLPVNLDEIEADFAQVAIELPLGASSESEVKAFDTSNSLWKNLGSVEWRFVEVDRWNHKRIAAIETLLSVR